MADSRHWVVIRLNALGDVLLTTGVLRHWHETRALRFSFITRNAWLPLLNGHPAVEEAVGLEPEALRGMNWLRTASCLAGRFSREGLVDLHGVPRTRLLQLLWQGQVRTYPKYALRRRLFGTYGVRRLLKPLLAHSVPQRYSLAMETQAPPREVLRPVLYLTEAERCRARELLGSQANRTVLLHPFATHANKRWPETHWRDLIERLDADGVPWRLLGRTDGRTRSWTDAFADCSLINRTDLRLSAACIAGAACLVSGDSGPMHMGTAVETPVVALFGPTHRVWGFYPSGRQDQVLEVPLACRPCSLHGGKRCSQNNACMRGITADSVYDAVKRILEGRGI